MTSQEKTTERTLYVLVRGWVNKDAWILKLFKKYKAFGGEIPAPFIDLVKGLPNADVITPELEMGFFSVKEPTQVAGKLSDDISHAWQSGNYDQIVIVAYSAGAPVARYALTTAFGIDDLCHYDKSRELDWAPNVVRVIYLSGILRGWQITTALPPLVRFQAPLALALVRALRFILRHGAPLITQLKKGESFIVLGRLKQTILRQLVKQKRLKAKGLDIMEQGINAKLPFEQVSLLGTRDQFVAPTDCIEPGYSGSTVYAEIPKTDHPAIMNVDTDTTDEPPEVIVQRKKMILRALSDSLESMRTDDSYAIHPDDLNDHFDALDTPLTTMKIGQQQTEQIVVVLHGIRDNGFWTKRIARMLKHKSQRPTLRAPTPSYGFFSMLDFIRPLRRNQQSKWFLDFYAQMCERFEGLDVGLDSDQPVGISFVGHSNGTYLAKRAMELCDAIRFDSLVFAGSVVRTDFNWQQHKAQVKGRVLNIIGANDRVVGLAPGLFERLGLCLDVGGAGYYGFNGAAESSSADKVRVHNHFVQGGHSDVISEANWITIRDFITSEVIPSSQSSKQAEQTRQSLALPILLALLLTLVVGLGLWCLYTSLPDEWPVLKAAFLVLIALGIRKVLRFF